MVSAASLNESLFPAELHHQLIHSLSLAQGYPTQSPGTLITQELCTEGFWGKDPAGMAYRSSSWPRKPLPLTWL